MKRKLIVLTSLMCLTAFTALCQDERFKAGEFEISPFATYVDKTGDDWGLGAAATYFLTDKIGVGASTYWADFGGTFIDNIEGEAYFRLPLFDRIAPYRSAVSATSSKPMNGSKPWALALTSGSLRS